MNRPFPSTAPAGNQSGCWTGPFGHGSAASLVNPGGSWFRGLREKRWCYMGIFHEDLILGCAVVHLGYITSAFVFVCDRQQHRFIEKTAILPPLGFTRFSLTPETGVCSFRAPGLTLDQTLDLPHACAIRTQIFTSGRTLEAEIQLAASASVSPVHCLLPMAGQDRAFTTKAAGLRARGRVKFKSKTIDLGKNRATGILDWTHGIYPRTTRWNWACATGNDIQGRRLGVNFSQHLYIHGQDENIIWVDGTPFPAGPVTFFMDRELPLRPWRILGRNRCIDLTFVPEGLRRAHDNLGIAASRFIQPWGTFTGTLQPQGHPAMTLDSAVGVVEDHFARW